MRTVVLIRLVVVVVVLVDRLAAGLLLALDTHPFDTFDHLAQPIALPQTHLSAQSLLDDPPEVLVRSLRVGEVRLERLDQVRGSERLVDRGDGRT